jgi:hypothetical protein
LARDEARWGVAMAEARSTGPITLNTIILLLTSPPSRQFIEKQSSATNLDGSRDQGGADAFGQPGFGPQTSRVERLSNPFLESDPRHESWAAFAEKRVPNRLKSAVDDAAGDNERINGALTDLMKAPPSERQQLWKEVLPTLHRRQPHNWPETAPPDDNQIIEALRPALTDQYAVVLGRLDTLAEEALKQFVVSGEDIGPYVETVRYVAESTLALFPAPSDRFRDQVGELQKRRETDVRELAESDATAIPREAQVLDGDSGVAPRPAGDSEESATERAHEAPANAELSRSPTAAEIREQRRVLRDNYKSECKTNGVRVTDAMIAEAANANWHGRTTTQKWLACDPRYDGEPDRLIRSVFTRKHHIPAKP